MPVSLSLSLRDVRAATRQASRPPLGVQTNDLGLSSPWHPAELTSPWLVPPAGTQRGRPARAGVSRVPRTSRDGVEGSLRMAMEPKSGAGVPSRARDDEGIPNRESEIAREGAALMTSPRKRSGAPNSDGCLCTHSRCPFWRTGFHIWQALHVGVQLRDK